MVFMTMHLPFTTAFTLVTTSHNVTEVSTKLPIELTKVHEKTISLYFTNRSDRITLICQQNGNILPTNLLNLSKSPLCQIPAREVAFWIIIVITYITIFIIFLIHFVVNDIKNNDQQTLSNDSSNCKACSYNDKRVNSTSFYQY